MTVVSKWRRFGMDDRVRQALETLTRSQHSHGHHRNVYVTSYQIAITVDQQDPDLCAALGKTLGGGGSGADMNLANYISSQLGREISASHGSHYAEKALVSNELVVRMVYRTASGDEIHASLPGGDRTMTVFRLRSTPD